MNKKYRLRSRRDFSFTYRKGKSVANSYLVLVYRKNSLPINRVGFSVSKKFGNAVKRNKIKRRLREIVRQSLESIENGNDMIFIVRKNAQQADFKQLQEAVRNLFGRANLYKNSKK